MYTFCTIYNVIDVYYLTEEVVLFVIMTRGSIRRL